MPSYVPGLNPNFLQLAGNFNMANPYSMHGNGHIPPGMPHHPASNFLQSASMHSGLQREKETGLMQAPDLSPLGIQPSPAIMANPKARERITKALLRAQQQQQHQQHQSHPMVGLGRPEFMQGTSFPVNSDAVQAPEFGWSVIDGVQIPYLLRDNKRYVAVRMVETKLLSKYPSTYPEELKHRAPLMSHYCSLREVKLLNHINANLCGGEYGTQLFTDTDLIVKLSDFEAFYSIVKKHFPGAPPTQASPQTLPPPPKIDGGWLQLNNTVVPYLLRMGVKHVPLSVVRYAAGLLTDVQVEGVKPTDQECALLDESCHNAGLSFSFSNSTKLITIDTVLDLAKEIVTVVDLPKNDPFGSAQYQAEFDTNLNGGSQHGDIYSPGLPASGSITPRSMEGGENKTVSPFAEVNNNGESINNKTSSLHDVLDLTKPEKNDQNPVNGNNSRLSLYQNQETRPVPRQPPPLIKATPGMMFGNNQEQNNYGQQAIVNALANARGLQSANTQDFSHSRPNPTSAASPSFTTSSPSSPTDAQKGSASVPSRPAAALTRAWPREQVRHELNPTNQSILLASGVTRPRGRPPKSASSENNKPPSVTTVRVSTPTGDNDSKVKITAIPFHGRNISCLVKDDGIDGLQPFVLVEALARVFFPLCPLPDFLKAVHTGLPYGVQDLNEEEEQAFIKYYSLPTKKLKCNQIVKLKDIEEFMPKLERFFKGKGRIKAPSPAKKEEETDDATSEENPTDAEDLRKTPPPTCIASTGNSQKHNLSVGKSSSLSDLHIPPSSPPSQVQARSETPFVPLALSGSSDISFADRNSPTDLTMSDPGSDTNNSESSKVVVGQKRPSSASSIIGPKAKNSCSRSLENAIAKLQNRALGSGNSSSSDSPPHEIQSD